MSSVLHNHLIEYYNQLLQFDEPSALITGTYYNLGSSSKYILNLQAIASLIKHIWAPLFRRAFTHFFFTGWTFHNNVILSSSSQDMHCSILEDTYPCLMNGNGITSATGGALRRPPVYLHANSLHAHFSCTAHTDEPVYAHTFYNRRYWLSCSKSFFS